MERRRSGVGRRRSGVGRRRSDVGSIGVHRFALGLAFGAGPQCLFPGAYDGRTLLLFKLGKPGAAVRRRRVGVVDFPFGHDTCQHQGVVKFIRVSECGPGFVAYPGNGFRAQPGQVSGVGGVQEAPGNDRIGAAFFRGRVIQECIRARVQDFLRQRRRAAQVATMEPDAPVFISA